ncbi:Gastrula zinc finger protein XlCGF49.1 [Amphibalanus amphitrite]|uniref:Protein krueppel n=1 Tax=Amphibalanus amphitrite TaxID=1232801 RepID=A0A6A4VEK2_AMPAM|nr:Gastrula zinc finger protein XlCGF49.1 [Amphibalanus amphitrite]
MLGCYVDSGARRIRAMIISAGPLSMEVADAPPSDGEMPKTPAPAPVPLSAAPSSAGRRAAGRPAPRRDADGSAPGANPHGGYHCSYCGKYFSSRSNMVVHERTHTHERPYTCSYCGRTFSQHGQMVIHVRSHTGQRPFKCSHCDKAFTSSKVLKIHVRTHTGEKPYACEHCDKRFAAYANLVVHRRIHTKARPYNCRHCKRTFEHSGNLQRHVRAHGIANGDEVGDDPCGAEAEQCRATAAVEAAAAAAATAAGLRCRLCQAAYSGPASLLEHRCPRLVRRPRRGAAQDTADAQPLSFTELFEYIGQLRRQATEDPAAVPAPEPPLGNPPATPWQPHQQQVPNQQPVETTDPDEQLQLPQIPPEPSQENGLELPVAAAELQSLQPLEPSPEAPALPPNAQQEQEQEEEQYRLHVLQPRPRLTELQPISIRRDQATSQDELQKQPELQKDQQSEELRDQSHQSLPNDLPAVGGVLQQQRAALLQSAAAYPTSLAGLSPQQQQRYAAHAAGLGVPPYYPDSVRNGALMAYGHGIPQRMVNGFFAALYQGGAAPDARVAQDDELVITVKPARSEAASALKSAVSPAGRGREAGAAAVEAPDVTITRETQPPPPAPHKSPSRAAVPRGRLRAPTAAATGVPVSAVRRPLSVTAPQASAAAPPPQVLSPPAKRRRACPGLVPLSVAPPTAPTGEGRRVSVGAPPSAGQWPPVWGAAQGRRAPGARRARGVNRHGEP